MLFTQRRTLIAALLATGQVTSYGSGTGVDDGALKKGIVKAYQILTTGQYSGTVNITINSKTDAHSNNCVIDLLTGLMWSRTPSASVGPASNGLLPWTTTGSGGTAEGIFPYAAGANTASLAGYADWRIPNKYELHSLTKEEGTSAGPDSTAFPSWDNVNIFWSSTTKPAATGGAIQLAYSSGEGSSASKIGTGLVALVRSLYA